MPHNWTDSEDAALRSALGQGLTYDAAADALAAEGMSVTANAIRKRAKRIDANPGSPSAREPRQDPIPPGIRGGARFQRLAVPVKQGDRLVVMNDTQFPYHDSRTLVTLERFVFDFEPHILVWNGDMYDFYDLSDFDKSSGRASNLQHELDIGQRIQERWANHLPAAQRILIEGNHEDRLRRFIWQHPGIGSLRSLDASVLLSADGAWRVLPYGSQVRIPGGNGNDVIIEHGSFVRQKSGHSAWAQFLSRGTSGIMGHVHRFAVIAHRNVRGQHVYIENGCLCRLDPEYGPFPDWQQAFTYGFINNGSIHLYPTRILEDGFRAEGRWYRRDH